MNILDDKEKELVEFCKSRRRQWKHGGWGVAAFGAVMMIEIAIFAAFDEKWRKLLSGTTTIIVNGIPKMVNPYKVIVILALAVTALLIAMGVSQLNHLRRTNKLVEIIDKLQTKQAEPEETK
jgi:hypothetical protein